MFKVVVIIIIITMHNLNTRYNLDFDHDTSPYDKVRRSITSVIHTIYAKLKHPFIYENNQW